MVPELPRPASVLMVSAHWESAPISVSATSSGVPLLYDTGFPQRFYEVLRRAGRPETARSVAGLLSGAGETLPRRTRREGSTTAPTCR